MRPYLRAAVAVALGLSGLAAATVPAVGASAATGSLQVSVISGALKATADSGLAAFPARDALQISSPSAGTVRIRMWNEVDETAGSAILWSNDSRCTSVSASSPVSAITCTTVTSALIDFSATSTTTSTVVMDATPLSFVGGSGPDEVYGGSGPDTINGGGGGDTLYGGPAGDYINGDAGDDSIDGEEGNDNLIAGTGNDRLVSAEDVAEKDNLVQCGDSSGDDKLDIDPLLDVTKNCQGIGNASAPANVQATGTVNSSSNAIINATWAASSGAAAYQVDYSTDGGAIWTSLIRVELPRLAAWNAGPLRGAITLRVSAVKSTAVSSGVLSNTVTLGSTPAAPTAFRATGWANEDTLENGFRLSWASAQAPTSYDVQYRRCASAGECADWTSATVNGAVTTAEYTVSAPGSYEVRIRAVDSTGLPSAWANARVTVPTGAVTTVTGVNAWGSADAFMVLWTSSSLATKWLKGYRIQMQYNDPNGTVSQWEDVRETSGTRTALRLTAKSLGTKSGDIVRFRVITVPVYGADSRASNASPRRQQTDSVPAPSDFAATYDTVTDYLTMTWKNPAITNRGGANVGGYDFAYMWPGSTTWTQLGSPLSYDSERSVFSLENVPRGTFKVRIRSIGWPDSLYSDWTVTRSIRK